MIIGKSIVVVANSWNPAVFTADWLNANSGIKDFKTEILMAPLVTVATSQKIKFVCEPQKLQLLLNDPVNANMRDLAKMINAILRKQPETNFTALGVNFKGRLDFSSEEEIFEFIKRYVSVKAIPGFCKENDDSLKVIVHLIKDNILGSRLTIKMLPAIEVKFHKYVLIVDFNFHNDVTSLADIRKKLKNVDRKERKSLKILEAIKNATN